MCLSSGSTRSPMESQRMPSHSRVRRRTRSTRLRLSTNAMKLGAVSSRGKALPRHHHTTYQCKSDILCAVAISYALNSKNVTVENSPGFTRRDDPIYRSLPAEKREPAAPIDPSSKYSLLDGVMLSNLYRQSTSGSIYRPPRCE